MTTCERISWQATLERIHEASPEALLALMAELRQSGADRGRGIAFAGNDLGPDGLEDAA